MTVGAQEEKASKMSLSTVGAAPGVGESHLVFPSDCFERPRRGDTFDVRDEVDIDDREMVCAELVSE